MTRKKVLSILCAAALTASLASGFPRDIADSIGAVLGADALDASGECEKNCVYTFDSDTGVLTISAGDSGEDAVIGNVFQYEGEILSVVINDGVTGIGSGTFWGSQFIKTVYIPGSVTEIGSDAFYICVGITDVYCNFDPVNLTWTEGGFVDDFNRSGVMTKLHCPSDCYDDFYQKLDGEVNVQIVGDLPSLSGMERVAEVPATCISSGSIAYYVDPDTGTKYSDRQKTSVLSDNDIVIPPDTVNGHSWSGWYIETSATSTQKGVQQCDCVFCGSNKQREYEYSTDPYYVVTIPASVTVGETASMSLEFWGDLNKYFENLDTDESNSQPEFSGKGIYVYVDEINGKPISETNNQLVLNRQTEGSDDHQADSLKCSVTACNYYMTSSYDEELESTVYSTQKGQPYPLLSRINVMQGFLEVTSRNVREDSAELEFIIDSDDEANAKPGNYYGTLTFRIALVDDTYNMEGSINYGAADSSPFYLHQ